MVRRQIWCFAWGQPGDWEALCPDFDIAVQGGSLDEVRCLLGEAVRTYAEDAQREDPRTAARLLNRKAPLGVRMKLAGSLLKHILRGDGERDSRAGFDIPCPA